MHHFTDTAEHTAALPNRDATLLPRSTRELAMLIERQSQQVAELLRVIEMDRAWRAGTPVNPQPAPTPTPAPAAVPTPREVILEALATAADGKPGRMTTAELQMLTGLGKSALHHHANELLDRGQVVILKGKRDPSTGRRGPNVVVHADAIAV